MAQRLGTETILVTALGNDGQSTEIRESIERLGIDLREISDK